MSYLNAASAGALATGLLCAAPGFADVTAQEVWDAWKGLSQGTGQTVTGTETQSGDTLTVSDVTLSTSMDADSTATVALGDIIFTEQRDGTVVVTMAADYPIRVTARADDGEAVEMAMRVRQDGLSLVASGDPQAIRYDFSAPEIGVTLDSLLVNGDPVDTAFDMVMTRPEGRYLLAQGSPRRFDSAFDADSLRVTAAGHDPEDDTRFTLAATLRDVSSTSVGAVPDGPTGDTLSEMLAAGIDVTGRLAHKGMDYTMQVAEAESPTAITTSAASGSLDVALGADGLTYAVDSTDTRIALSGPTIPFPQIDIAMQDAALRIQMPMTPTAEPADFAFLTRLGGLTVSEQIWAMLDPAGQLARDPATLVLDLAGKSRWTTDITDPTTDTDGAAPGELHALTVKEMRLSLAGAELTGTGDFTFDNADTQTFDGMPRPEGNLALRLDGGNSLLDRLVGMGLIPAEQATGMRMMLGMFARPGAGNDTLVSDITVTEDGQVLANGQRLR